MKDATGELSMTAVAVVAIAAIAVVFTTLIWPAIKSNITRSARCSQAYKCDGETCYYLDENNSELSVICKDKNDSQ